MAAVEGGEALLVGGLVRVVELLGDALADLGDHVGRVEAAEALLQQHPEQLGVGEVGLDGVADARVLHLDGHRPLLAGGRVDGDGAVDLADRGGGDRLRIPLHEQLGRRPAELALDDLGGEVARHRRGRRLQRGQRLAHRLGEAVVEVAGHLADLHQRALHVAEPLGDLLGRAQLGRLRQLGAALGRGEQLAGVGCRVRRADGDAEAGQLEVAPGARRAVDRPGEAGAAEQDADADEGRGDEGEDPEPAAHRLRSGRAATARPRRARARRGRAGRRRRRARRRSGTPWRRGSTRTAGSGGGSGRRRPAS